VRVEELGDAVGVHLSVLAELLAIVVSVDHDEFMTTCGQLLANLRKKKRERKGRRGQNPCVGKKNRRLSKDAVLAEPSW